MQVKVLTDKQQEFNGGTKTTFAQTNAGQRTEEKMGTTTKKGCAHAVVKGLWQTNTKKGNIVPRLAQ